MICTTFLPNGVNVVTLFYGACSGLLPFHVASGTLQHTKGTSCTGSKRDLRLWSAFSYSAVQLDRRAASQKLSGASAAIQP
jgi:hypothetical protein